VCQRSTRTDSECSPRHGVKHLTAEVRNLPDGGWDPHELERMKDNCDKYGVLLEAIRMKSQYIYKLRKGPEREREIDIIIGNIRKAANIPVKIITCHCEVIPYRRNGKTAGGRGATCDSFKLEDDWKSVPMGGEGRVTHEDYWERITYFFADLRARRLRLHQFDHLRRRPHATRARDRGRLLHPTRRASMVDPMALRYE
jgi:hypothetical protein